MSLAFQKVIEYLKECGDRIEEVKILQSIPTELINVKEAFLIGRTLQKLFEFEAETSSTGISETEILDAIRYVEQNMEQAKY